MTFGYKKEELVKLGAANTAGEIVQQPEFWGITYGIMEERQEEIKQFLKEHMTQDTRILLTGAGTSAYIGDTVRGYIESCTGIRTDSVATTDIVANPEEVLSIHSNIVMVSFARSGDSPESIGAYELFQKHVKNAVQVIITCNKDGKLAKIASNNKHSYTIMLPEETNDKGFAMTSSFSCMMLVALLFFDIYHMDDNKKYVDILRKQGEAILTQQWVKMKELSKAKPGRIVYLGSGCLSGLAQELALKNMELSNGRIATINESILGFRHGPKSFMDNQTFIIVLMSQNEYTNRYNKDLLYEIHHDLGEHKLIVLSYRKEDSLKQLCDTYITTVYHI